MTALATAPRKPRRRHTETREFRRESLLRAALVTVAEYDIEAATVARICAQANASRGLISHYFSSKEALLVSALRSLFDNAQEIKEAIASDSSLDPVERIRRIAHSSFTSPVYSWEMVAAWQAFTNASRHNAVYREPIRASTQASVNTVTPLFELVSKQQRLRVSSGEAAMGLYILIDGLWNSLATGKDGLQTAQAITFCNTYIEGSLGQA